MRLERPPATFRNCVQIAGVIDAEEADLLSESNVDFAGVPLGVPVHNEGMTDADAASLIRSANRSISFVLITYLETADAIHNLCKRIGVGFVQLHGDIAVDEAAALREFDASLSIIKALVIDERGSADFSRDVVSFSPYVDAFITDTFDMATGARGATGKTHDWMVSRRIVELSNRPVILAGGLTPANVARAIAVVQPAGVDAHTGVEDETGRKTKELVTSFVSEARDAFARRR